MIQKQPNSAYVSAMKSLQARVRELTQRQTCLQQQIQLKQDIINAKIRDSKKQGQQYNRKCKQMQGMKQSSLQRQSQLKREIASIRQIFRQFQDKTKFKLQKYSIAQLTLKTQIQQLRKQIVSISQLKDLGQIRINELKLQNQTLKSQIRKAKDILKHQRERRRLIENNYSHQIDHLHSLQYQSYSPNCNFPDSKSQYCSRTNRKQHKDQSFSFSQTKSCSSLIQENPQVRQLQSELTELTKLYESKANVALKPNTKMNELKSLREQMLKLAQQIQGKHQKLLFLRG